MCCKMYPGFWFYLDMVKSIDQEMIATESIVCYSIFKANQ